MTGIRHTDVKGISSGNPVCLPPVTCGDSPVGACGSASLRRHLHCFGFLPETSLTLRCGPEGPSNLNPQSLRDSPLLRGATPFPPPASGTAMDTAFGGIRIFDTGEGRNVAK